VLGISVLFGNGVSKADFLRWRVCGAEFVFFLTSALGEKVRFVEGTGKEKRCVDDSGLPARARNLTRALEAVNGTLDPRHVQKDLFVATTPTSGLCQHG
jgi:hypothetical protein